MTFRRYKRQETERVKRWLENKRGDVISVVEIPNHYDYGEIRYGGKNDRFAIPGSLERIMRLTDREMVGKVKRINKERKWMKI